MPVIIKGIWTTAVTTLTVEEAVQEVFYLFTSGMLLAFGINKGDKSERPDFMFIIADIGYVTREETRLDKSRTKQLHSNTKRRLETMYKPVKLIL